MKGSTRSIRRLRTAGGFGPAGLFLALLWPVRKVFSSAWKTVPSPLRERGEAVFDSRILRSLASLAIMVALIAGLFSMNRGATRPEEGDGLGALGSSEPSGIVVEPVQPPVAGAPALEVQPPVQAGPSQPAPQNPRPSSFATGITESKIKLGFVVAERDPSLAGTVPDEFNNGNDRVQVQAVVDDLNQRPIHGRTIEPFYIADRPSPTDQSQRQCIQFAQDAKVFATLNIGIGSQDFYSCLARRRTLMINAGGWMGDDEYQRSLAPWAWWPSHKSDSRMYRTLISTLKDRGFFGPDPVIGLVTLDRPLFTRLANNVVKPALGFSPGRDQEFLLNVPEKCQLLCAVNQLEPQTESAVQMFKEKGVTHVLFIPGGGSFFFMGNAEEREFRPKYALETNMAPASQILNSLGPSQFNGFAQNALNNQLNGAMGIGWQPQEDIGGSAELSPHEKRCLDLVGARTGLNTSERNSTPSALQFCDVIWAFEAAANRAGRDLTPDSLVGGLKGLGTSWPSVRTFKSDLGQNRPDGSIAHRVLKWNGSAFVYDSGVIDD